MPALRRHRRAILTGRLARRAALLLAALSFPVPAYAQSPFDPNAVAYVLCVTNETKRLALLIPPIPKNDVIERAFGACGDDEAMLRQSLAAQNFSEAAAGERIANTKKFIRQNAPDDIERLRANSLRPR